jgi:hypothetical protein
MKTLFALLVLLLTSACAEDFYFNRCDAGAHPSCATEGNNAAAGTSPSAPKRDIVGQINFDTVPAGSRFLFACGGKWNMPDQIYTERPSVKFVFDWYQHPSGPACVKDESSVGEPTSSDTRPQLHRSANGQAFFFRSGDHTVAHLRLYNSVSEGFGIINMPPSVNFTVTDVNIRGFAISFYPQHDAARSPHVGLYAARNVFSHASSMGILGSCSSCIFEHNLFYRINNRDGANGFSHGFYYGSHAVQTSDVTIRCNRFIDNSIDTAQGKCTGGTLTAHGQVDRISVLNNYLEVSATYGATLTCVGISFNPGYDSAEWFYNTVLRNNFVKNIGQGIVVTSAPGIVIDNNTIIAPTATDTRTGISLPGFGDGTGGDVADGNAVISNNLVYFGANPTSGSIGISTSGGAAGMGTNVQLRNNRVHMVSNTNNVKCFSLRDTPSAYSRIEGLVCSGAGNNWMNSYATRELFNTRFSGIPSGAVAGAADPGSLAMPSSPTTCSAPGPISPPTPVPVPVAPVAPPQPATVPSAPTRDVASFSTQVQMGFGIILLNCTMALL